MQTLKIGLIGTGYMGKAHAIALKAAPTVFSLSATPVCGLLAEVDDELAEREGAGLPFDPRRFPLCCRKLTAARQVARLHSRSGQHRSAKYSLSPTRHRAGSIAGPISARITTDHLIR